MFRALAVATILVVSASATIGSIAAGSSRPATSHPQDRPSARIAHDPAAHRPSRATAPPSLAPGLGPPFTVETETLRLFDPSRTTPARGGVPASPGRLLITDLFVPSGAPDPRPLVVFAHGWNSDPDVYRPLLERWAQAGFLVAAPVFPDSSDLYPGSPVSNYAAQALDISFVITSLLEDDTVKVDASRIAVAGHSDGGTDVALLALDPAFADTRVRAYLCLSGEMPSGVAPYAIGPTGAALLVAVGSADEYGLLPRSSEVFDMAQASSKALVVEQGGSHLGSFVSTDPAAAAMREDSLRFLELALEPRAPSSADIVAALDTPAYGGLSVVAPN